MDHVCDYLALSIEKFNNITFLCQFEEIENRHFHFFLVIKS